MMKLSDLILAIGDEKVQIQNLDTCADKLDWSAKNGTKVTFGTEVRINPNGLEKLGMVIWLDREAVAAALSPGAQDHE